MMEDADLQISGGRFSATYVISGSPAEAKQVAQAICVEQTVEFPEDLLPRAIREHVLGRIESLQESSPGRWQAVISFADETVGGLLPQLLNVLFGNVSLMPGIRLQEVALSEGVLRHFPGPRFGRTGLRALLGVEGRPILSTALKPMGMSSRQLARMAYAFAVGGVDMIKDDHGLADQPFAPWKERVALCAEAVREANARTGRRSIYMPNLTGPAPSLLDRAHEAQEAGAGGLLVSPGLVGWDTMRSLAADPDLSLPVMSHPAFLGSFVTRPESGASHLALFGQWMRLAGADAVIYPNYGGRFSFSRSECLEIVRGTELAMGHVLPALPAPGGGMRLDRVPELRATYGEQVILLIGGDLFRGGDLEASSRRFLDMLTR